MSNLINEDLFKISQLDYTNSYGKYDMNKITGKSSYDKYITDKKNQQKIQKSSNSNAADKYKLNSIILQPESDSILLSTDSILNFANKKVIAERLKTNSSYIIHAIEYKYIDYRKGADGTTLIPSEQKEILFIDNYCNYHILRTGINNEEYIVIPNNQLKHFQLPNQIIDIIKTLSGCQILGFNYNFNNIYTILDGFGNYIQNYYNVQNKKVEIHANTTIDLSTKLEVTNQTVTDLSTTLEIHQKTINDLTIKIDENNNLINTLKDTITKLNIEKEKIRNQSDKYREEITQYKFNNILYIETTD
jgi:hypothetical protein